MFRPVSPTWLALLALAFTSGCGDGRPREGEGVPPELAFQGLTFRVYRGSTLEATGQAQRASLRRDSSDAAAEAIRIWFPRTPEREETRLVAARGTGNLRERRFQVEGGVRAEQAREVATTASARYSAADGLVRGDERVDVSGGDFTVQGPGFTLDPRDEVVRLSGSTSGRAGGETSP